VRPTGGGGGTCGPLGPPGPGWSAGYRARRSKRRCDVAQVYKGVEQIAAHEAREAVREKAEELATRARSRLAAHRSSGNARIEVSQGRKSDRSEEHTSEL